MVIFSISQMTCWTKSTD